MQLKWPSVHVCIFQPCPYFMKMPLLYLLPHVSPCKRGGACHWRRCGALFIQTSGFDCRRVLWIQSLCRSTRCWVSLSSCSTPAEQMSLWGLWCRRLRASRGKIAKTQWKAAVPHEAVLCSLADSSWCYTVHHTLQFIERFHATYSICILLKIDL